MSELVFCEVEKARGAAVAWSAREVQARCAALARLRLIIAENADMLAATIAREIGKPLQEAYGADILPSLAALQWLVKTAPTVLKEKKVVGGRGAFVQAEAFGVVGVIGTWNYPLFLNIAPIAWALAAGNAVVWKPSELAAETGGALAGLFERANLPVFIIRGGADAGQALCRAGCDKIAFTGGAATGRKILAALAPSGTPSVMELSGNDAMLVCADADAALAARSAVWGRICNAGQSCVAPQRIYVHADIYDKFLLLCQNEIERLQAGADYGPMRTEALQIRAHVMVKDAIARGARLLAGGYCCPERDEPFYAPTLLADCDETMLAVKQDFFGPILPVCRAAGEREAIERANANDMALGAGVWSRDTRRAADIARQLRVGIVTINDVLLDAANPALPFGGMRSSGFGKQRGVAGLEEFVTWKTVVPHKSGGTRRHLFPYRAATLPILRGVVNLQSAQGLSAKWKAARELGQAAMRWQKEENGQD